MKIKKRSRFNYWSCSKFADWIRGTPKPLGLSWEDWEKWHKDSEDKYPLRYWIAEKLLVKLQDIFYWPGDVIYTIRVYIRNRFIDQTHVLKTGLNAGESYDLDTRILYGLFNELVDLIETEYAYLSTYEDKKKYKFKNGRCIEAGLDYLEWASNLDYQPQAKTAQKTIELYTWWKNRDNRPDPHKLFTKEKNGKYYFLKIDKMEREYYKEDNKMLIQLIKIREGLWC